MAKKVVTFGEIMMRLAPSEFLRFGQTRCFEVTYGGGEANVAVSLAHFGLPVEYVSRLPENDLADACLQYLRQYGVGVAHIARGGRRMGIYFLEKGAAQRASKVIYDRDDSSFAAIKAGMIDWPAIFAAAGWFHWTGITPAISPGAAEACGEAIRIAKEMNLIVSCDLNYRKTLWKYGKNTGEVMPGLVAQCDVAIGNEEDAAKIFGIKAPGVNVTSGRIQAEQYQFVCEELSRRFPNLKMIAITLRGSLSASRNTWSAVAWRDGHFLTAPSFDIDPVVDRVGGGDAFAAGLIFGLMKDPENPQWALEFAVAASCLKHSIAGDFNLASTAEVEQLMSGDASGRISR